MKYTLVELFLKNTVLTALQMLDRLGYHPVHLAVLENKAEFLVELLDQVGQRERERERKRKRKRYLEIFSFLLGASV